MTTGMDCLLSTEAVLPADGNVLLAEPRAELKLGARRLSSPAVTVDRPRLEASVRGHAVRLADRFNDRVAVDARLRAGGVQAGEASVGVVDLQLHTHRHTTTENGSSVLARELTTPNLKFLLAAQPTRGLDVGAVEAVYASTVLGDPMIAAIVLPALSRLDLGKLTRR